MCFSRSLSLFSILRNNDLIDIIAIGSQWEMCGAGYINPEKEFFPIFYLIWKMTSTKGKWDVINSPGRDIWMNL